MSQTVPGMTLGSTNQKAQIREILESNLPESVMESVDKRDPGFSRLLRQVLNGEIKAEFPAFRVSMCQAVAGNHPSVWMEWEDIRAAVSSSLVQTEAKVERCVRTGKSVTLRDIFPLESFYLLAKSSFDELIKDTTTVYQGDALTTQFNIWKEGIDQLMNSMEVGENYSAEQWVLDQVAVLDWNSALVNGPFSRLPPPLPRRYTDATWRKDHGKTRASLVMTPAGHISYCHADDNLAGFEILTIHGYKIWFIWDSTPESIKKQQARMDQGLTLDNFEWCLEELGHPTVYITAPGTIFIGNPGYLHGVFSLTPAAHWAIPIVCEKMRPRKMELLPIWQDWLHRHHKYISHSPEEQENEDNDLGQTVRDLDVCTKVCLGMWSDWEKEQEQSE